MIYAYRTEEPLSAVDSWYFGHCSKAQIMEIREAEQMYLVRKRHGFLDMERRLAEEEKKTSKSVAPQREIFLDEQSYQKYRGRVKAKDLDLFFIHFMMTAKQSYPSIQAWYRRFVPDDKGYMTKQEWCEPGAFFFHISSSFLTPF